MKYFILPLTKSPHSGRVGPRHLQDWYQALKKTVFWARTEYATLKLPSSRVSEDMPLIFGALPATILILSDVQVSGERHEVSLYNEALDEMNYQGPRKVVLEAQETIGQLDRAFEISEQEHCRLVVVSTFLHYPRVRWLCRGKGAIHKCVWGIPRPKEAVTDLILVFLSPFLELTGLDYAFLTMVEKRRKKGIH